MRFPNLLAVALILCVPISAASADPIVVSFDDLVGGDRVEEAVPLGYGGIDWFNSWNHYGLSQPPYTAHSIPQRVYSRNYVTGSVRENFFAFLAPNQIFLGAWFAGYSIFNGVPSFVQFSLYNDGQLAHISAPLVPTGTPTFLDAAYNGSVDMVGVVSNTPGWVMDDVTYGPMAATPEPATLLLLSAGLAGLATRRRRPALGDV
jgi:hypothetical protein